MNLFTGIIQRVGKIQVVNHVSGDAQMVFATGEEFLKHTSLGDSIAVNGCCLTVTQLWPAAFAADVSRETLNVTTLKHWQSEQAVNLERAL